MDFHIIRWAGVKVLIDPKLIIEFAAVAQERSFIRAAQRLRVAQPWLSARIAKLERILGFRLLERTTRSVALTARGAAFLPIAEEMTRISEVADRMGRQLERRERRVLRIGAAPYTRIISERHEMLNDFASAQTDISIELETAWSVSLVAKLKAGEIDLSFLMGAVDPTKFQSLVIAHYGLAITVSRSHKWTDRPLLDLKDMAGQSVQVFTRSLNSDLWDHLYSPLVGAGCQFIEMPEMAEGAPMRMRSSEDAAAFFDFGADDPGGVEIVRIPLKSQVAVPFQLLRSVNSASDIDQRFWEMAQQHIKRSSTSTVS
jgi:DNA-binding transcriptional LysR family regulator